jgi:hypothetical protein
MLRLILRSALCSAGVISRLAFATVSHASPLLDCELWRGEFIVMRPKSRPGTTIKAHWQDTVAKVHTKSLRFCGNDNICAAELDRAMWACLGAAFLDVQNKAGNNSKHWNVPVWVASGFSDFCKLASVDDASFDTFRIHQNMANVVEHVQPAEGANIFKLLQLVCLLQRQP